MGWMHRQLEHHGQPAISPGPVSGDTSMSCWRLTSLAALLLNVSPRTLTRWIADGRLPVLRVGRIVRISRAAEAYLTARAACPPGARLPKLTGYSRGS
jgi:excisionase family DNA binding protein